MISNINRVQVLNDIIVGIARRSQYKFKDLSVDDISQQLWLRILEAGESDENELDLNLVANICYKEVVDMQRRGIIRNHYTMGSGDLFPDDNLNYDNYDMLLMTRELCEMFPPESQEGTYIRYWATESNYKDYGYRPNGKYKEGFTESELAKLLGFSSMNHRGYKRFRGHMREFVRNYFGITD